MFIFLDNETTGNVPADRLCQLAFKTTEGLTVNELLNPGIPITIDAMHSPYHQRNGSEPAVFRDSPVRQQLSDLVNSTDNVMVAHNAAFTVEMLALVPDSSRSGGCDVIDRLSKQGKTKVYTPRNLGGLKMHLLNKDVGY